MIGRMLMQSGKLEIKSSAYMEMIDITTHIETITRSSKIDAGICFLFNPHTTAGLTINEGADPDVCIDIIAGLQHLVPKLSFRHVEGNSPSHIMATLVGSSLSLFIDNRRLILGQWQRVFFCEFDGPRNRHIHWRIAATS